MISIQLLLLATVLLGTHAHYVRTSLPELPVAMVKSFRPIDLPQLETADDKTNLVVDDHELSAITNAAVDEDTATTTTEKIDAQQQQQQQQQRLTTNAAIHLILPPDFSQKKQQDAKEMLDESVDDAEFKLKQTKMEEEEKKIGSRTRK